MLAWLRRLSQPGVDLQKYFHKEAELHPNGELVEIGSHRKGIIRRFIVHYGTSQDAAIFFVEDIWHKPENIPKFLGSWDPDVEYAGSISGLSYSSYQASVPNGEDILNPIFWS